MAAKYMCSSRRGHRLVLCHEFHPHWLFYFLLGIEEDAFAIPSLEFHGYLFSNGAMSFELHSMFLVCHLASLMKVAPDSATEV
jgi:hypothetical protein